MEILKIAELMHLTIYIHVHDMQGNYTTTTYNGIGDTTVHISYTPG
jgi:hypothetical protein